MTDPKRGRDIDEKILPREDERTRRETERQGSRQPKPHEKGDGERSGREARQM